RRRFIAAARARDRGARREGSGVYGIVSGDRVRRARRCALAGENSWRATRREAIRRARRPALREESGQPLLFLQDRALRPGRSRSEEHTSELQSLAYLVCRLLLEKKKQL